MKHAIRFAVAAALAVGGSAAAAAELQARTSIPSAPVVFWSRVAQNTIVPKKFPGEAAVYMGIVHAAMYDTALAFEGGYQPYAVGITAAPGASADAAIATVAHDVLVCLLSPSFDLSDLESTYATYLMTLADDSAKIDGMTLGAEVASATCALRANDGRHNTPPYVQPTPGPGVYVPDPTKPVVGLTLAQIRPLAMGTPSQFRPDGPNALTSSEYAEDFNQTKSLGQSDSPFRTPDQTLQALFWTDHDLRQWNDGMLGIAADRGLDFLQTARMLAMVHVSGGDAMIACFDAKFHYMFWRPYTAIAEADTDGNPNTARQDGWQPLRATPNFPEYPSAHACHSGAVTNALASFFGTDKVRFSLYSRVTDTVRQYDRLHDALKDVNEARVLAGFHFRNSDQQGANLGRAVARFVTDRFFQPLP